MDFVIRAVISGRKVWFWWAQECLHASEPRVLTEVARAARAVDADLNFGNDAYWLLRATYDCVVTLAPTHEFLGMFSSFDEMVD
jgi:hypothetical protein